MTIDQPPPSQNGAKPSVPQHNGAAKRPGLGKKRPSELRMENRAAYRAATSIYHRKKNSDEAGRTVGVQTLWLGIDAQEHNGEVLVGIASHDGTYSVDSHTFRFQKTSGPSEQEHVAAIQDELIEKLDRYRQEHLYKFAGAGLSTEAAKLYPQLHCLLWDKLDIVPFVFELNYERFLQDDLSALVEEHADSMARKCLENYGPLNMPRLMIKHGQQVCVDADGLAHMTSLEQYMDTVGERTWKATLKYAESLKANNIRIAFLNSTPQGGGVALMRHALIRFLRLLNVNAKWYVPKPNPKIFRTTKNNHNILQGVAEPGVHLAVDEKEALDAWCQQNADRYFTREGEGPLAHPGKGGAHIIIVDDPQMPSLVKIAKQIDPDRPVIFRSHIQVRADLADQEGTPTAEVWNWVWDHVKDADLFISHPVREFVPSIVHFPRVGYMPATTDWLDGLNKFMGVFDNEYYLEEFEMECHRLRMTTLKFPDRPYIVQIARFDPSKGIPDVLASYAELRRNFMKDAEPEKTPQLVVAGHGAIDDPDATQIYDDTLQLLDTKYADIKEDVVVMRLGPTDQVLNALMSNAHVALQLSTREGFEVKVSEALHKGVPIIATKAGGIPLQVQDGKSGFLVEPGDSSAVAKHLHHLFTDDEAYHDMSKFAHDHVSDEVGTVGNALCWLYLADTLTKQEKAIKEAKEPEKVKRLEPNSAWINDMAREEAGLPYEEGETRLPRSKKLDLTQ